MAISTLATITLWHALQQGPVLNTFNEIVEEYNRTHPHHQVVTEVHPGTNPAFVDYGAPAAEALATTIDRRPDLVLAPEYQTSLMNQALSEKRVRPIGEFISPEILDRIADIHKRTFGDKEGRLSSLPFNPSCGVLYANATLVTEDEMPKTLEEMMAISRKLIGEKRVTHGFTSAWPAAYLGGEIPAAQRNVPLALPNNGKEGHGRYQLSTDFFYRHAQTLRQLQKDGILLYAGQTNEASTPFLEKRTAFFLQGAGHAPFLEKKAHEAGFAIRVASLPTLSLGVNPKDKSPPPLGGSSLWVLDKARTEEMVAAVKEFSTYLASDEVQMRWHKETACVPVLKDLDQKLEEFYRDHPAHRAVVEQTLRALPAEYGLGIHMPNWAEARKEWFNLIEKILGIEVHTSPDGKMKTFTVSDHPPSDDEVKALLHQFDEKYSLRL